MKMYPDVWLDRGLSVEHSLIGFGDFAEVRQSFYDAENSPQLFQKISVTYVFDLLYEIAPFYRI